MKDYSEIVARLQRGLGRAYQDSAMILGVPGTSVAVKIDPHHYLAVMPAFLSRLAEWAGVFPDTAREALVRSGNLVTSGPGREAVLPVTAVWGTPPTSRRINACFVLAEFVDRAIRLYGAEPAPPPVADLRLSGADHEAVQAFFQGKTCIDKTAFTQHD